MSVFVPRKSLSLAKDIPGPKTSVIVEVTVSYIYVTQLKPNAKLLLGCNLFLGMLTATLAVFSKAHFIKKLRGQLCLLGVMYCVVTYFRILTSFQLYALSKVTK